MTFLGSCYDACFCLTNALFCAIIYVRSLVAEFVLCQINICISLNLLVGSERSHQLGCDKQVVFRSALRDEIQLQGWYIMQVYFRFNSLLVTISYRFGFSGNNNINRHYCLVSKVGM